MKKVAIIIGFLLFLPMVNATPLDYFESVVELDEDESSFTFIFLFREAPGGSFEYFLPFGIENFETSSNFKNYTCKQERKDWGTNIKCDFFFFFEGGRALNIKFTTKETIKKMEEQYQFSANVKTPQDVDEYLLKVVLEQGIVLIEEPDVSTTIVPYSPTDGTRGSNGREIFVEWEREGVKKGEGIDATVNYETVNGMVPENNNTVFILIGILILIIAIMLSVRTKKENEVDISVLKKDEKMIIDIIKSNAGMCKQRHVVRETDFSKAKVSRLIKDLEERGLIRTEKVGRTNRLYIKKSSE